MSVRDLEPSAEVLDVLQLNRKQFHISLDLSGEAGGLTRIVVMKRYEPSDDEVDELIDRSFLFQRDGHLHATAMGAAVLKAVAEYMRGAVS
jgi:hypothetical protein